MTTWMSRFALFWFELPRAFIDFMQALPDGSLYPL